MEIIDSIVTLLLGVGIVVVVVWRRRDLKTVHWIGLILTAAVIAVALALERSHRDATLIILCAYLFAAGGYGVALFIRTKESHWLWWAIWILFATSFTLAVYWYALIRGA